MMASRPSKCSILTATVFLAVLSPGTLGQQQKMPPHTRLSSSEGLPSLEGPVFLLEPPSSLVFSNSTGGTISCSAHGSPPPDIRWMDSRGKELTNIPRIREISSNGSLIVLPFHPTQFRPSVHAATVRCRAANHVGIILSRECKLKPDLSSEAWQPSVADVFVAIGNVAVLHCDVTGSSASSFQAASSRPATPHPGSKVTLRRRSSAILRVAAWLKEHPVHGGRTTVHPGGRYTVTKRGSLHIQEVSREDGYARFFCQAVHRLTGQRRTSPPGRIIVTEPVSQIPPRIDHFLPSVKVRAGQATDLVCAAQGNPPPSYRWYKEFEGTLREIHDPGRDAHPGAAPFRPQPKASVLHFPRSSSSDAGAYVCAVGSPSGEDRRRMYLEVAVSGGGGGGDSLEISLHPQQAVVDAGSPVSFNCTVMGGVAARKISWLKDGQPVLAAGRVSVAEAQSRMMAGGGVSGALLRVENVRRGDQGMYQCLAAGRVVAGGHYLDGDDEEKDDNAQGSAELSLGAVGPELLWTFIEQTLQPGPPVSLRCSSSANPAPHIEWLLDGGEVMTGGDDGYSLGSYTIAGYPSGVVVVSHLNITSARVMHGGLYTCVASNGVGRPVAHSAALNVYGPPSARPPRNVTAVAGSDAHLRCPVAGFPIASVAWRRSNGGVDFTRSPPASSSSMSFAHSTRFHSLPNGTLLIREVEASEDAGEYSCIATDPHGHAARAALQLHVMKPPEIAPFTFPTNLREGMRAQVSCSVISGDFPTGLSWRKDGRPLAVSGGSEGSGTAIDPDVQETRQHLFVSSLLFLRLAARHAGNYTCIASNAAATAEYTAVMEVKVAPSWVTEPQDTSILWRQLVVLHCQAEGFPDPTITWMKARGSDGTDFVTLGTGMTSFPSFPGSSSQYPDFSQIGGYVAQISPHQHFKLGSTQFPNQQSLLLMPNGSLVLRSAAPDHEGYYSCKATNGIGAGLTKVIFLQVNVPAHFHEHVINVSAAAGDGAVLTCQAEGDHPLRVAFTSTPRGGHLPLSHSIGGSSGEPAGMIGTGPFKTVLQLPVVTREDAGPYHCSASNTYGEDTMVIYLQVKEPPQSPGRPEVLEAGSRWASIEWIPSTSTLYPAATPPAHSPIGPLPPAAASTPPVLHYVLQYRLNDEISWSNLTVSNMVSSERGGTTIRESMQKAKLSNLRPASRYRLRVIAVNEVGFGPPSPETSFLTTQEAPSGPPTEVIAEATGPEAIVVRWKPLLASYSNGEILGYQIAYREVLQPARSMTSMGSNIGGNKEIMHTTPVGHLRVRNIRGQGRTEATLSGLRPYSHYEVAVRAFNAIGPGPPSPPTVAVTFEGVPGSPPANLRCSPLSSQSLWVRWDPLSPRDRHGLLEGYKVLYKRMVAPDNDVPQRESVTHGRFSVDVGSDIEVKRTTNLETNLHGLARFTNYTVHILAFTSMGDGVRSPPVHCATEEDIPGPPEHIKAMALGPDGVLVAWSTPASHNGIILRYNVYYHPLNGGSAFSLHHQPSSSGTGGGDGGPKDVTKELVFVSGNDHSRFSYEARRLKEFQRYEFWVSAVTGVGEGPSSTRVILAPTSRVPARIPAFPLRLNVRYGQSIRLDCPIIGVPPPTRKWRRLAGQNKLNGIQTTGEMSLQSTGPILSLTASSSAVEGNYSCQAENPFGTDEVWWEVRVSVVPSPPRISLRRAEPEALSVQWRVGDSGGSSITGFTLDYKREFGEWQEKVDLEADCRSHMLKGLHCGSTYHLRLAARNVVGTGQYSSILTATTKGSAPRVPEAEDFLQTNSTSVSLHLDAWPSGGCPLLYFVVEYKVLSEDRRKDSGPWKLISNNVQPTRGESGKGSKERLGPYWDQTGTLGSDWALWGGEAGLEEEEEAIFTVPELMPATWYALRVTAHTDAGSVRHEFLFATRNSAGEVIEVPPDNPAGDRKDSGSGGAGDNRGGTYGGSGYLSPAFYADPGVVVPVLSGIICAAAAGICIALAVRRKRYYHGYKQGDQGSERDTSGTKTLAELENQRNNEQRHIIGYCQERVIDVREQSIPTHQHQLYSPSPGRKGESSLSGQKSSDCSSGQDYEICPYATFSLPGGGNSGRDGKGQIGPGMGAMDYSMKFHTFGNQECYAGQPPSPSMLSSEGKSEKKLNCPRARRKSNVGPQGEAGCGMSKSPPDGLNLEISCISSQQTLPLATSSSPSSIMVGGGSLLGGRYRYAEYASSSPPPQNANSPSPLGHSKSYPTIESTIGSGGGRSDSEDNSGGGRALPQPPIVGEGAQYGHQQHRLHHFQSSQRLTVTQGTSFTEEGISREAGSSTESAEVSPIPSTMGHWTRNGAAGGIHGGIGGVGGWRNMMSATR